MRRILIELRVSLIATLSLAVILCGIYPVFIWAIAQGCFPGKANGSLVVIDGMIRGSSLLSQNFAGARYFHPRPSAAGAGYDAASSGGSNLGPTSRKLVDAIQRRVTDYRRENNLRAGVLVPADAVTCSASGLDPHISLRNALLQASRVARARGLSESDVRSQIEICSEGRDLGIFGEPRVNVVTLNMALDNRVR